jgi:hypothetical protein
VKRSTCRTCRADIIWAVSANGKAMPIDADPAPGGNVRLTVTTPNMAPSATVLGPLDIVMADDVDELRWPHHATCPNWTKR